MTFKITDGRQSAVAVWPVCPDRPELNGLLVVTVIMVVLIITFLSVLLGSRSAALILQGSLNQAQVLQAPVLTSSVPCIVVDVHHAMQCRRGTAVPPLRCCCTALPSAVRLAAGFSTV